MNFEKKYFQKFNFSRESINNYYQNALKDLDIAKENDLAEIKFTYSYQALIKIGITLIAKAGNVKVRSIPGHHIKILDKLSKILDDKDISTFGNRMRLKRNIDLYSGGEIITEKEANEYFEFVENIFSRAKKLISNG